MPFQRTLKFKYGRVESPNHKSAPKWQNGAIFLGHEKSRVHPCVQATEPEPTFASSAQASIRPSGRHPSPPLRSPHLRTCSTLAGAKSLSKRGETFQDVRHSADAAASLRRNRSPAWGMGSTRQRASRSTPRPCRECPPPVLLLIESASASGSVHPPPNPVIPLTRGKWDPFCRT